MSSNTMRAIVLYQPGPPSNLTLETRPIPTAQPGHVLIRVRAFGLNRSEMFTRQGHSPNVKFPRILGIEATGEVEDAPGGEFQKGDAVVTAMGDMGRSFDGGYADYTVVPAKQVMKIDLKRVFGEKEVRWEVLAALPELVQTAWGSLFTALELKKEDRVLIRGGTSSVGLAAAAIAKDHGCFVAATTRQKGREAFLKEFGVDEVVVDTGAIAGEVKERFPQGFTKVLELVGTTTLEDSLQCAAPKGIVCMTGIAGNKWAFDQFAPMNSIPSTVKLTIYSGGPEDVMGTPIEEIAIKIASGKMMAIPTKVFKMEQIVEAHELMEGKGAMGKIVMLT